MWSDWSCYGDLSPKLSWSSKAVETLALWSACIERVSLVVIGSLLSIMGGGMSFGAMPEDIIEAPAIPRRDSGFFVAL